jgi:hypothetical protein
MRARFGARLNSRLRLLLPVGAAILSFAAVSACSDFDRILDVAFPPAVPGLTDGQAWLDLPIGGWVTEGEVSAGAMAACFARACATPAGVGLFRAEGHEAALLRDLIANPERLKAGLERNDRADKTARRRRVAITVDVRPLAVDALRGFTIRIARTDGRQPAYGAVLASPGAGGSLAFVLVVAASEEAAQRLATAAAAGLS